MVVLSAPNCPQVVVSLAPVPFHNTTVSASAEVDHKMANPVAASKVFLSMNPPLSIFFLSQLLSCRAFQNSSGWAIIPEIERFSYRCSVVLVLVGPRFEHDLVLRGYW